MQVLIGLFFVLWLAGVAVRRLVETPEARRRRLLDRQLRDLERDLETVLKARRGCSRHGGRGLLR